MVVVGTGRGVAWALVGGLLAGGAAWWTLSDDPYPFAATGATCALICRAGTRRH